ncbi:hypothetical protein P4126_31805 [Pseudomonas aeruginosa]|nr:hypothetical protein [Pseudomonas aeruginosa]
MSAAASAAAAIGFGVKTQEAAAMSASIATLLFIDPITLEYKIFGPCCHFCPDHLIVSHYQPVALVEVIKGVEIRYSANPLVAHSVWARTTTITHRWQSVSGNCRTGRSTSQWAISRASFVVLMLLAPLTFP